MQYILTKEEYFDLVNKSTLEETESRLNRANENTKQVLDFMRAGGHCAFGGIYKGSYMNGRCDDCSLASLNSPIGNKICKHESYSK